MLNKLPKDILIKLVATIEKDTREKIFSETWSISRDLHNCSYCYQLYHANHKWHCVLFKGQHSEGICEKCYSNISEKEKYTKCEHFKRN